MINDKYIRMTLRLPRELYTKLRDKAFKKNKKHNPIIVSLIEKYVDEDLMTQRSKRVI